MKGTKRAEPQAKGRLAKTEPFEGRESRISLLLRAREKITSYFSRPDLGQIWTIRLSETAGLARLIRGSCD